MNILVPDSWLREFLKTEATVSQIKDDLSLCGPSVERLNKVGNYTVYDIEITSNRVDMASVFGVAREAHAILPRFGIKTTLRLPNIPRSIAPEEKTLPLIIEDKNKLCNRLLAVVIDNVKLGSSPEWMRERLEKSGVRSLNNAIDVTNYVMLELGHPCHVFDYDRIKTGKLIIRKAKKGEKLITLDDKECSLTDEDVVIDDGTGRIIDLPGIMGTKNSVVTNDTKRVILFIESNNPMNIRKTSMRLGLRSMAATINEKNPDPELAKDAILRASQLLKDLTTGKVASNLVDIYPNPPKPKPVETTVDFINQRLGIALPPSDILGILQSLGFNVKTIIKRKPTGDMTLSITPPSYRQFDVSIPEDIVEEVARIYGYHKLPPNIMDGPIPTNKKPTDLPIEEKVKTMLKFWGFTETYHYSFVSKKLLDKAGLDVKDHLKVANPLTEETEFMRTRLIPSLLETVEKNQNIKDDLELFELAKVYIPQKNSLPKEKSMLALVSQKDFYHLKGIIIALLKELGIEKYQSVPLNHHHLPKSHLFHPLQSLQLIIEGATISVLGALHPAFAQSFNIKKSTYIAYIDIETLVEHASSIKHFTPIPQYPPVIEDVTLNLPPQTHIGLIIEKIYKTSSLVKNVELLGKYEDTATLRITFQDPNKNLTIEDINIIRKKIKNF